MTWQVKKFNELTTTELFKIYYLRNRTFVVEQKRICQEVDDTDPQAIHIFDEKDGQILAYARVYLIDAGQKVSFGRVVTSKTVRGKGVGKQLMEHVMTAIQKYFPGKPIEIESQKYVEGFYKKFGFQSQGKTFIFESTPHVVMTHPSL